MTKHHARSFGIRVALAALTLSTAAAAVEPQPRVVTEAEGEAPSGPDQAAVLLSTLAEHAREARQVTSGAALATSAAALTAGLLLDYEYDRGFGTVLWISGIVTASGSLLGFFAPGQMERFAATHGAGAPGYRPGALEVSWRAEADRARFIRTAAGVVNLVIGAGGLATGAILFSGAGDLERSKRADWGGVALVGGGAFVTAGLTSMFSKSDIEKGFELAYPSAPAAEAAGIQLGIGAGSLQVSGTF